MEILDTYLENGSRGRIEYTLYQDRVHLHCRQHFGSHYETNVPLKSLLPMTDLIRCRSAYFQVGLWMLIIPTMIVGLRYDIYHKPILEGIGGFLVAMRSEER